MQSRLFSYPDTQRHRLGVNYQQLPVNAPLKVANFQRAGAGSFVSQGPRPSYQSSIQPLSYAGRPAAADGVLKELERHEIYVGGAYRDLSEITERKIPLVHNSSVCSSFI